MGFKQMLRKNRIVSDGAAWLRAAEAFLGDFRRFRKFNLDKARKRGNRDYEVMLLCHAIEKGLSAPHPRYFGEEKLLRLAEALQGSNGHLGRFEAELGWEVVLAWLEYCEANGYGFGNVSADELRRNAIAGLRRAEGSIRKGGARMFDSFESLVTPDAFDKAIMSRVSMRRYADGGIPEDIFERCARHFIAAPSACNRQMCRLYWVKSRCGRAVLAEKLAGLMGFDVEKASFFIVTFDLSSLSGFGERNQGYLNAGLAAMNFDNALHVNGIGSTFLQWANREADTRLLRESCGIPEQESVAVVIAAGPYPENITVPASKRRPLADVAIVVGD